MFVTQQEFPVSFHSDCKLCSIVNNSINLDVLNGYRSSNSHSRYPLNDNIILPWYFIGYKSRFPHLLQTSFLSGLWNCITGLVFSDLVGLVFKQFFITFQWYRVFSLFPTFILCLRPIVKSTHCGWLDFLFISRQGNVFVVCTSFLHP